MIGTNNGLLMDLSLILIEYKLLTVFFVLLLCLIVWYLTYGYKFKSDDK